MTELFCSDFAKRTTYSSQLKSYSHFQVHYCNHSCMTERDGCLFKKIQLTPVSCLVFYQSLQRCKNIKPTFIKIHDQTTSSKQFDMYQLHCCFWRLHKLDKASHNIEYNSGCFQKRPLAAYFIAVPIFSRGHHTDINDINDACRRLEV